MHSALHRKASLFLKVLGLLALLILFHIYVYIYAWGRFIYINQKYNYYQLKLSFLFHHQFRFLLVDDLFNSVIEFLDFDILSWNIVDSSIVFKLRNDRHIPVLHFICYCIYISLLGEQDLLLFFEINTFNSGKKFFFYLIVLPFKSSSKTITNNGKDFILLVFKASAILFKLFADLFV